MNLMIVPGMFVYSSFLISVCMFIVSNALIISSVKVICLSSSSLFLIMCVWMGFIVSLREDCNY